MGSILSLQQNSRIVSDLKKKEQEEIQKREFLKQQLYFSNTEEFIEIQAREKLGMVKPGEKIVIVPLKQEETTNTIEFDNTPNWKKWWSLLF